MLLSAARAGDAGAGAQLFPIVYDQLRGLARAVFSDQRHGHTLQPTALAHEAWMKLAGNLGNLDDRNHFFVVAAKAMRQILTDYARSRNALKRGGANVRLTLDPDAVAANDVDDPAGSDLIAFDDALTRLAELNPRHAQVVELRALGGLTIAETAQSIGVSHGTVESDWAMARAWLRNELRATG